MTEYSVSSIKKTTNQLFDEVGKVVIGQRDVLKQIMISLLTDSHSILEGYPGLAKTLAVNTLSNLMDLKFSRIQNTPDLMPSDVTGTYVLDEEKGKRTFRFQPGPVFANIVLADEINRATPKTQSALLEAMQEKQVTVGNTTFKLDEPFFVLATQNPIEQEGTYPLPEAQTDRFLLKIKVKYPSLDEEINIADKYTKSKSIPNLKPIVDKKKLMELQKITRHVPIAADIKKYAVGLVHKTRKKKDLIEYGASPRASIGLILSSKARALLEGRKHVSKEDIKTMAFPVLRHRIIPTFEAERSNLSTDDIIKQLVKKDD